MTHNHTAEEYEIASGMIHDYIIKLDDVAFLLRFAIEFYGLGGEEGDVEKSKRCAEARSLTYRARDLLKQVVEP